MSVLRSGHVEARGPLSRRTLGGPNVTERTRPRPREAFARHLLMALAAGQYSRHIATQFCGARVVGRIVRGGAVIFKRTHLLGFTSLVDIAIRRDSLSEPVIKPKYRGTTLYFHVHAELVRAAQYRGVTTYQDIAVIMGLGSTGSHMGREVGYILGEISEDEVVAGRPMLSSVAVDVRGKVGEGFFTLARQLGRLSATSSESEYLSQERNATHDAWRRPLPSAK